MKHVCKWMALLLVLCVTLSGAAAETAPALQGEVLAENAFMQEAIDQARTGILSGDGGPFGSVVVKDGEIVGEGHNRVLANNDPASGIAHTAHLAGAFAGFLYIDQLFESTLLRKLWGRVRDYVAQRPHVPRAAPPPPDQAEVDRILDKISAQGIQSLTKAERQTLHRASRTF